MSDGGGSDDGGGTPFANSPTYDPSSPVDSPGGGDGGGGGGSTPVQNEAAQQAPAAAEGEAADVNAVWEAIQDDEGRTYYYNNNTGESSWEAPPGLKGGVGGAAAHSGAGEQAEGGQAAAAIAAAAASSDQPQRWTGYKDDEGRTYYYNETTGETQWERPEEGPNVIVVEEEDMEAEAEAEVDAEQRAQQQQEERQGASEPMEEGEYAAEKDGGEVDSTKSAMEVEQVPEEEVKDPRQVALEKAEAALTKTDAVMELGKSLRGVQPLLDICQKIPA